MESKETLDQPIDQAAHAPNEQEQQVENQENKAASVASAYAKLSEVELINALRDLLHAGDFDRIKEEVEWIRSAFYKKHNAQVEKEKEAFLSEGGELKDFLSSNELYAKDIRELLGSYRRLREEKNKQLERDREDNLAKKYAIIEQIKQLVETEESMHNTFHEFNELQKQWRETGQVPQLALQDLWDSYHHHVEKFYDYIRINQELRDLDFQRNLEAKTHLCEKAEALKDERSVDRARGDLQSYHEQWREIGPVPREQREELWGRFKAASSHVNKQHQDFYLQRKEEELKNLTSKEALCEEVEAFSGLQLKNHKQWDEYVTKIKTIQSQWRTIGYAPKKDNNKIYERFCSACDTFFNQRRQFYNSQKEEQKQNLKLKEDLCEKAEALQHSEDWKETGDALIDLQNQWKKIGSTSRKQSDAIWRRFRTACDVFFNNKSKHFTSGDEEQEENLRKKRALIDELQNYNMGENADDQNFAELKAFQLRWSGIGHVPYKQKDELIKKFRQALNSSYDKLKLTSKEKNMMLFKHKVEELSESDSPSKIRQEREKIQSNIKHLERELATLENNISFFSNSDSAHALVSEVKRKIEQTRLKLAEEQEKLKILRNNDK